MNNRRLVDTTLPDIPLVSTSISETDTVEILAHETTLAAVASDDNTSPVAFALSESTQYPPRFIDSTETLTASTSVGVSLDEVTSTVIATDRPMSSSSNRTAPPWEIGGNFK